MAQVTLHVQKGDGNVCLRLAEKFDIQQTRCLLRAEVL